MTITFTTGANKGLGHEIARRLIEKGRTVIIGARSPRQPKMFNIMKDPSTC